jgi:hypothetical protein
MKAGMTWAGSLVAVAMIGLACGGSNQQEAQAPSGGAASGSDAGASSATGPTAVDAAPVDAAPERPFAETPDKATSLIDDAVSTRVAPITTCVAEARTRRKDVHAKVIVEIGIDQEGNLIGVKTPKGQPDDKVLNACVQRALQGAPFPRSHAGVITIKKTFEDQTVYR